MYQHGLKPRLKKVIEAAKNVNPEVLIRYHSYGYVEPFIPDLIEIVVFILKPVQSDCMDFKDVHDKYGDKISFNGTTGTQNFMPFGNPHELKAEMKRNLSTAGKKAGLFCCPTHMLELEVPWKNISTGESDPSLTALFFQYGRYLMIAGSRKDPPLPMHLQGTWNDGLAAAMGWTCDYHLDINTQQIYWPSEVTNLSEGGQPLFCLIESLQKPGNLTAR